MQSEMLSMCFGGLTPCHELVESVLDPSDGSEKRVLDLGSGSGIWYVEMAKKFPHAEVLGVDLVSPRLENPPRNCRFEVHDINDGLSKFYGTFDVVHARFIDSGLKDHHKFMLDAERCLKPGGVFVVICASHLLTEDDTPYPPFTQANPQGSWFQRIFFVMERGLKNQGNNMDISEGIFCEGLWNHKLLDRTSCRGAIFTPPIGLWASASDSHKNATIKKLGELWRNNLMTVNRHFEKGFLNAKRPAEEYPLYGPNIDEELLQDRHRSLMQVRALWGQSHGKNYKVSETFEGGASSSEGGFTLATIYSDQVQWGNRLSSYRANFTPEMKALINDSSFDVLKHHYEAEL
ncbi:hypothetical protein FRB91_004056 [Serendipita sp. 411]|nr:hypothetical protein FRB91_004056 [Serendipita sp. 411]